MTDPIADLLARIRNGLTARHEEISVPHSVMKLGIVKILYDEGYLAAYKVADGERGGKAIAVRLRYSRDKKPVIVKLSRNSRPGRRVTVGYRDLRPIRKGMGLAILSTPKGILTDRQAREEKIGGELLCTVW